LDILESIRELLSEILDIEPQEVTPDTYIIRDLGAESIDLLELAVSLNARFGIEVNDDEVFLLRLRDFVMEAEEQGINPADHLAEKLPFLSGDRVREILADLEGGPTLKVADLVSYVKRQRNGRR